MGVEGINNNGLQQTDIALAADMTGTDAVQVAEEVMPLFAAGSNVSVTGTSRVDDKDNVRNNADDPELEEANLLLAIEADLEALVALLSVEQDEKTIEASKKRIESLQGNLKAHHDSTMKKVNESIDEMKKQEESSLATKILGWIGVAVAIAACVALCVTGAGAVAIGLAVFGAAMGLGMQIANETGGMEKLTKALAKSIQNTFGCDKASGEAAAQGVLAGIAIIVSLACMICGNYAGAAKTAAHIGAAAAKVLKVAITATSLTLGAANLAASTAAAHINYSAQSKQADVTETQKTLLELQTLLEQESEDLQELLNQLNDALSVVMDLLQSKQDALNDIAQHIGA